VLHPWHDVVTGVTSEETVTWEDKQIVCATQLMAREFRIANYNVFVLNVTESSRHTKVTLNFPSNYKAILTSDSVNFVLSLSCMLMAQSRVGTILPQYGANGVSKTGYSQLALLDKGQKASATVVQLFFLGFLEKGLVQGVKC